MVSYISTYVHTWKALCMLEATEAATLKMDLSAFITGIIFHKIVSINGIYFSKVAGGRNDVRSVDYVV